MKPISRAKHAFRNTPGSRTLSALAIALLLGASAARSQSVGDLLGKAKDIKNKVDKATGRKSKKDGDTKDGDAKKDADTSKDGGASKDGDAKKDSDSTKGGAASKRGASKGSGDSEHPGDTVEEQQQFISKMAADKRPVDPAQRTYLDPNYDYRRLTVNDKFAVKLTCDDAAAKVFIEENVPAWTMMSQAVRGLETELHYGERASYLKAGLGKVKEIHFTTTSLRNDANNKGSRAYLYSFNSTTGVLAVAKSTAPRDYAASSGPIADDVTLEQWILAHMTNAPKVRPVDRSAEYAGQMGSSGPSSSSGSGSTPAKGSQAKSWTCTWCHETVVAPTRPSLAGCPRNTAGQHAWHN